MKQKIVLFLLMLLTSLLESQSVQRLNPSLTTLVRSMGIVNPFEGLGGIPTLYHLYANNSNDDSASYVLNEISIGGNLQLNNTYILNNNLPDKHFLLHQVVNNGFWYAFGYEKVDSTDTRFFVTQIDIIDNRPQLKSNFVYSDFVATDNTSVEIFGSEALPSNQTSFSGYYELDGKLEPVLAVFNETTKSLNLINYNKDETFIPYYLDAFIKQDSLYAISVNKDDIAVFTPSFDYVENRNIDSEENPDFEFGPSLAYQDWGDGFVISGHTLFSGSQRTGSDFYFQEYNNNFELIYQERFYKPEGQFSVGLKPFVTLTNNYGVMLSYSGGNVQLRLYERNTNSSSLFELENENIALLEDAHATDLKILLFGFLKPDSTNTDGIRYYLVDYNETIVGINEVNRNENTSIKIYPNPNKTGKVNLSWSSMDSQSWHLNIYDSQGKVVFETSISQGNTESQITLPQLHKGSYILRATGSSKQVHTGTMLVE